MPENSVVRYVKKNWPLMSAGEANGIFYSADVIKEGFLNTVWDKNTTSLFLDHEPNKAQTWVGEVKNLHFDGENLLGDIYVYDLNTVNKLKAGAKFGISPEIEGKTEGDEMKEMRFLNFNIVFEPAVKTTYLNKEGNQVRVKYLNPQTYYLSEQGNDKEILIEQVVDPAIARFCFVDSDGNLCRRVGSQGRNYPNMEEDKNENGNDGQEEAKEEQTEQKADETKQELAEIKKMLSDVVKEVQELKKKKERYPYPTIKNDDEDEGGDEEDSGSEEELKEELKKKKKEEYPAPEELKKKERYKYPEVPKDRQMMGEELPEDIIEALREINSDYTDFVKQYIKEHKGEGSAAELMKKAAKEWKARVKEKEQELNKKELQENRKTVPQVTDGSETIEVSLRDLDVELAKVLLENQASLSQR